MNRPSRTRPSGQAAAPAGPPSSATGNAVPRGTLLVTAASGLLLFVLGLAAPIPQGPPVGQASADRIRDFVTDSDLALRLAVAGGLLGVVALLVFTASLAGQLRAVRPGSAAVGSVAGAGLLVAVVYLLDVAAVGMPRLLPGLIDTSLADVEDDVLLGWYGLTGYTHFLGDLQMAPIAVVLVGYSVVGLRLRLLPRWLGASGAVIGAAAAIGTLGATLAWSALYPLWFVGLFGWWLWTVAVAISSAVRWRRSRAG